MLVIELRPGETVSIGDIAKVTFIQKKGEKARLGFDADRNIQIKRVDNNSPASVAASAGIFGNDRVA